MKFSERRKVLNDIPIGQYCYDEKSCKYWESIDEGRAKCTLYDIEDEIPYDLTLLWDQVKVCNLKY